MTAISADSINLNVIECGSGRSLLLLHGLGSCGDDWQLQIASFSRDYRVIAPDLRGHGHTPNSVDCVTVSLLARDMATMLTALNISATHMVGWSLGGLVAQQLAIDFPERVKRLVLVNTFAHLWPTNVYETFILGRRAVVSALFPIKTTARIVASDLFPKPDQVDLREIVKSRVGGNDIREYRKFIRAIRSFDLRPQLTRIQAPTLVITGDHDNVVPRGCQMQLVHSIPNVEWKIIPDSGHATPIDQAEVFNQIVLEFLGKDEDGRVKYETQPSDSSYRLHPSSL